MDMRKFTEKSVTALQEAQSVAKEYGNQEIGQVHLFYALITADEGLIPQLLKKWRSIWKDCARRRREKLPVA